MKLVSYRGKGELDRARRLGIVVDGKVIGDARAAFARIMAGEGDTQAEAIAALRLPADGAAWLAAGPAAQSAAERTAEALTALKESDPGAMGIAGEALFMPLADAHLFAPLAPSKVIAAGRNYRAHHEEMSRSDMPYALPTSWFKGASAITGPNDDIVRPRPVQQMDYETEMAFVIGRRCKNVPAADAMAVVAGYTVANDITARDIGRLERAEGNRLLAKSFDGFCPMGPTFVTADEIADPNDMPIRTRVNGETRQDANTEEMIWKIPDIISYVSQIELEPGDVVLTGSPAGVASGKKDDNSWQLKPGDVLESEVEGIGTMRNTIVEDTRPPSWDWKT